MIDSKKAVKKGRKPTHGLTHHPLYKIYQLMIDRCNNNRNKGFKNYGGRGIMVCKLWNGKFINFYKWAIQNGYEKNKQLDRRRNNGNYSPQNCRFVTRKINCRNRRSNIFVIYNNEQLTVVEWAEKFNLDPQLIYSRIKSNYPLSKLFLPAKRVTPITIGEQTKTLIEWSIHFGVPKETVFERYRKGVRGDKLFYKGNMRSFGKTKTFTTH